LLKKVLRKCSKAQGLQDNIQAALNTDYQNLLTRTLGNKRQTAGDVV